MFGDRSRRYREFAERLRDMAASTRFAAMRAGDLELAAQFDRLAERTFGLPESARVRVEAAPDLRARLRSGPWSEP